MQMGDQYESLRRGVAAHELAHAPVWNELAGIEIQEIVIQQRRGEVPIGWVTIGRVEMETEEQGHWYAVGILAGQEADEQWSRQTGDPAILSRCSDDDRMYQRYLDHPWETPVSDWEIRRDAAQQVDRLWRRIECLVPELVERGCVPGHSIESFLR